MSVSLNEIARVSGDVVKHLFENVSLHGRCILSAFEPVNCATVIVAVSVPVIAFLGDSGSINEPGDSQRQEGGQYEQVADRESESFHRILSISRNPFCAATLPRISAVVIEQNRFRTA
jgi:hypothetical protein